MERIARVRLGDGRERLAEVHWYEANGVGKREFKIKRSSIKRSPHQLRITSPDVRFVVCVKSGGYVDLEPLKVYRVRHDAAANAECMLRVVEASGEDYLYPASYFRPIQGPRRLFEIVEESA